jgi:predicted ATP-binding protein involved in virulence
VNPDGSEVGLSNRWKDGESVVPYLMSYGYGPFRRLESSTALPTTFHFAQPLSRFTTLFAEEFGLPDAERGLTEWYVASIDKEHSNHQAAKVILDGMTTVINALLPEAVRVAVVTSEGVQFTTPSGVSLAARELSDGYRAFLALVLDLLRHLAARIGPEFAAAIKHPEGGVVVDVAALVLIDEADTHLHPSWQRELGPRLCQVFPKIQFIVTTHSPFVAQEATDDGLFVLTEGPNGTVTVEKPIRSVRGWTASQILTSPLFGLESTRDPETEETIRAAADLTAKEQEKKLTAAEKKRLKAAREWLRERLSAPGETYDDMLRQEKMAKYVDDTLNRLENGHP